MKKLITLFLVFAGMVGTASATSHLFVKFGSWWTNDGAVFYLNGVELETVNAFGDTWYHRSFESDQTGITIERRNPANGENWGTSNSFNVSGNTFIQINDNSIISLTTRWENVYLNDDWNSWGGNNERSHSFIGDGHDYYIDLNADELLKLRTDDYHFRFFVSNGGGHFSPQNDNDVISETDYASCENKEEGSFKITNNPNAKSVRISLSYNDNDTEGTWIWHVTATVTEYSQATSVMYVNATGKTNISNVHAYAWDTSNNGLLILGAWPGKQMTENGDGTYSLSDVSYNENMMIIFNDGSNNGTKTSDLTLAKNIVYDYDGPMSVTVSAGTYSMATLCSKYALDFSQVSTIQAYTITDANENTGVLTTSQITGKVPAETGLYIEGSSASVPAVIYTGSVGTNLLVGVTSDIHITQGNTNYILTTNNGAVATPKFFMVNGTDGNDVGAGKAYLQVPSSSRQSFWFDETTAIETIAQGQVIDGHAYNLAGLRVAQPTKGLYIVNGKKVIK